MASYTINHRSSDEVLAHHATGALVAVVAIGCLAVGAAVGAIAAQLGGKLIEVYAQHGRPGQPKAAELKRAWQITLAVWAVTIPLSFTRAAGVVGLAALLVTIAYIGYVLYLGATLAPSPAERDAAGELDTYLSGLAPTERVIQHPAGTTLRVIRPAQPETAPHR